MSTSNSRESADYHHGNLRRALIDAAAELVARDGHDSLSLREAARRAGVSHNAPYRHFADREALLAAVAAEGFNALAKAMTEAAQNAGPDRLREIGVAYVRFAVEQPRLFTLMFGPVLSRNAHPDLAVAMDWAFGILADRFGSSPPQPAERPRLIAAWAIVHGLANLLINTQLSARLMGEQPDIAELTRAVVTARVTEDD